MTSKENAVLKKAAWKLLSTAVIALSLAGMYSLQSDGAEKESTVVISKFYGAGGKEGVFSNDFIELYNPGTQDISLEGYILGYSSGRIEGMAGSTISKKKGCHTDTLFLSPLKYRTNYFLSPSLSISARYLSISFFLR